MIEIEEALKAADEGRYHLEPIMGSPKVGTVLAARVRELEAALADAHEELRGVRVCREVQTQEALEIAAERDTAIRERDAHADHIGFLDNQIAAFKANAVVAEAECQAAADLIEEKESALQASVERERALREALLKAMAYVMLAPQADPKLAQDLEIEIGRALSTPPSPASVEKPCLGHCQGCGGALSKLPDGLIGCAPCCAAYMSATPEQRGKGTW